MTLPQLALALAVFFSVSGFWWLLLVGIKAMFRSVPGNLQRPLCVWCRTKPATKYVDDEAVCDQCLCEFVIEGGREP